MRRSQQQIAKECIANYTAAFDGCATLRYCGEERRHVSDKTFISTIIIDTDFIATVIQNVRQGDLVTLTHEGVEIVAIADNEGAQVIAERISALTGGVVKLVRTVGI